MKKHWRFSLGHLPRRPQQPTQPRQGSRPRLTRQDLPLEAGDSPGRGRLRIPSPARREGRRPGGGQDSPHPQVSGPRPKYPAGHPVRATLPRGAEAFPGTRGIARPHCIQHPTPGGQGHGPGGPGPAEERAGRAARRRRQSCAFGPPEPPATCRWQRSPAPSCRRRPRKPRTQGAVGRGPAGRLGPVQVPKPGAHLRLMLACPQAPASPGRPWPRPRSGSTALQPRSPSAPAAASGGGKNCRQLRQRRRRRRRLGGHMGGRGLQPLRPDHRTPVSGVTDLIALVGMPCGSQPQGRCGYLQAPTVLQSYGYR